MRSQPTKKLWNALFDQQKRRDEERATGRRMSSGKRGTAKRGRAKKEGVKKRKNDWKGML